MSHVVRRLATAVIAAATVAALFAAATQAHPGHEHRGVGIRGPRGLLAGGPARAPQGEARHARLPRRRGGPRGRL